MTSEDIRSELERHPFIPFRLHMVSGKTLDVTVATTVALLQNAICILEPPVDSAREGDYNVVSLRNIERLEHLHNIRD
jgi:hypothetical protein